MKRLALIAAFGIGLAAPAIAAEHADPRVAGAAPGTIERLAADGAYMQYRRNARRASRNRARNAAGAAAAVGIAGAVIGGAIAASNRNRYYDDGYYSRPYGYYGRGGYYEY